MIAQEYRWYPVYTKSRSEKKALQQLQICGIEAYLPLRKTVKQWSDRKKIVEEPLFNSYIFVKISNREQTLVLSQPAISRFIYFSGEIAVMPEQQMADLKLLLASPNDIEVIQQQLEPGEKVIVNAGPFKGMLAEIVAYQSQKIVVLKLENLGYAIQIKTASKVLQTLS